MSNEIVPSSPFGKIAIVGSGAIGCYYGGLLARAGANVHFLMRSDLSAVRERGLRVTIQSPVLNDAFHIPAPNVAGSSSEIGPCDLVIVALKTTANTDFEKLIAPLLHEKTVILTLQNGLGSDEELAAHFGPDRIMGGLCFICVNRTAPGEILCLSPGTISFGEFGRAAGERIRAIAGIFSHAGVKCSVSDNLMELRWIKLVWNVPFNGLSIVAGGITTDKILADPGLEEVARGLMHEIIAAAAAFGYTIPDTFVEKQITRTRPMGPYKPSSLIDYLDGREVEVDSIWGEPLRRARGAGVSTPRLEMLHALLQSVTKKG